MRSVISAVSVSSVSGTFITTRRLAWVRSSTRSVLPNAPAPITLISLNRSNFRAIPLPLFVIVQNGRDVVPPAILIGQIDGLPAASLEIDAPARDEGPQFGFLHHVRQPVGAEQQKISGLPLPSGHIHLRDLLPPQP